MRRKTSITFWGWVLGYADDGSGMAFEKRFIRTDGRTILEMGSVKPSNYDYSGVAIPTLEDAHSHLADRKLKVAPGTPIAKVVRPPDGLKHRYLASASEKEVVASIRQGMDDLVRTGAAVTHEFREGGIEGVRAFRKALASMPPERREHFRPVVLGRPGASTERPKDEKDFWRKMKLLLRACDGLGLSAIGDGDPRWNAEVARFARRHGKRVEVHCSESERESVEAAIEAGAQQLVHMVHGTLEDFKRAEDAGVPVAVCTRSNEFFGLKAPVDLMAKAGVDIRVGTDNAFLGPPDLFEEARAFARVHKQAAGLSAFQILSFLLRRKDINGGLAIAPREGSQPDFLIVTIQTERPERAILARAKVEDVAAVVGAQGDPHA